MWVIAMSLVALSFHYRKLLLWCGELEKKRTVQAMNSKTENTKIPTSQGFTTWGPRFSFLHAIVHEGMRTWHRDCWMTLFRCPLQSVFSKIPCPHVKTCRSRIKHAGALASTVQQTRSTRWSFAIALLNASFLSPGHERPELLGTQSKNYHCS